MDCDTKYEKSMKKVRLFIEFDNGILSEEPQKHAIVRKQGYLIGLDPQLKTISDLSSCLLNVFELQNQCPNGLILFMGGAILFDFLSTSILGDKDIIQVKKKDKSFPEIVPKKRKAPDELESSEIKKIKGGHFDNTGLRKDVVTDFHAIAKQNETLCSGICPLQRLDEEPAQQKIRSFSEKAIKYYNETKGMEFEFVEPISCKSFFLVGSWYHLNFMAKPKSADSCGDLSPLLFFAEVIEMQTTRVAECCILELENTVSCRYCESYGEKVRHPSSGWKAGRVCYLPRYEVSFLRANLLWQDARTDQDFALYSEQAIQCYNHAKGTEYELVSWDEFKREFRWYHLNFEAKLKNANSDNPTTLFFAELKEFLKNSPIITACHILELENAVKRTSAFDLFILVALAIQMSANQANEQWCIILFGDTSLAVWGIGGSKKIFGSTLRI